MSNIHGNLLELTVVGCSKLKDTEWISRQDPYVCVEYASNRNRTRVSTDGGKNPTFQEKFVYSLIQGLRELNVNVWNSNTFSHDDFIGSGKVQLGKVLSQGFDDSSWPLQTKSGRYAGEVRLIMHYSNANENSYAAFYGMSSAPLVSMYSAPPPVSSMAYPLAASAGGYSSPFSISSYSYSYPPTTTTTNTNTNSGVYPYTYPPQESSYPPQPYPPYSFYPQSYGSRYPHGTSSYPGVYPPPY